MVTLEQKIGAKLVLMMPKNAQLFEIQAHVYQDYGFCMTLVDDPKTGLYKDVNIDETVSEELLDLIYALKEKTIQNHGEWTQCHISINKEKHIQFHFAKVPESAFYNQLLSEEVDDLSINDVLNSAMTAYQSVHTIKFDYEPKMLFALALDYAKGQNGFVKNTEYAYDYFSRLIRCENISLAAYYNWAALWLTVPVYWESAQMDVLELLRRVRKSDMPALFVLGLMYQSGYKDLKPNIKQAVHYYQRAALLGFTPAQLRISDLSLTGEGLEQK